jgi:hypothetical protein
MKCDKCGEEVLRMTFRKDGFGCEFCLPVDGQFGRAPGMIVKGENKYAPKMTHNEIMHIKTRRVGPDGRVHSAKRYETKDY